MKGRIDGEEREYNERKERKPVRADMEGRVADKEWKNRWKGEGSNVVAAWLPWYRRGSFADIDAIAQAGIMATGFGPAQLLGHITSGVALDKYGRRPVTVFGCSFVAIGLFSAAVGAPLSCYELHDGPVRQLMKSFS